MLSLIIILISFLVSLFLQFFICRYFKRRGFCSDSIEDERPQRFHKVGTSRAGGLGIFIGFLEDYGYKVVPK